MIIGFKIYGLKLLLRGSSYVRDLWTMRAEYRTRKCDAYECLSSPSLAENQGCQFSRASQTRIRIAPFVMVLNTIWLIRAFRCYWLVEQEIYAKGAQYIILLCKLLDVRNKCKGVSLTIKGGASKVSHCERIALRGFEIEL